MPLLPTLQQLQLLGRFCQEQKIPFPPISPSPEEQRQPQECHLFLHPDCPEAPAVLHFPLVNDSFREHSAPGEPRSQLLHFALLVPWAPCPTSLVLHASPTLTPSVHFPSMPALHSFFPRGPTDS